MANSRKTNIEKRRRLSDLYAKGGEVRFNAEGVVDSPMLNGKHQTLDQWKAEHGEDEEPPEFLWPTDNDIVVWVQPPNPLQREEAVRAASAAKARVQLAIKDPESQAYLDAEIFLNELDDEQRLNFVVDAATADVRSRAIREVLEEDEWSDFSALQDSVREWEEANFPETDEWEAVRRRDEEYGRQVQNRIKEIIEDTREGLSLLGPEALSERVRKRYGETLANQAFMQTYEIQMLFFACRDDENHDDLFFESVDDLRSEEEFVQVALANKLSDFIKDPKQAKNSRRVAPGSEQSVPPNAPETSEASTPEEQIA